MCLQWYLNIKPYYRIHALTHLTIPCRYHRISNASLTNPLYNAFVGSVFKVPIEDALDPSKCRMYGPGLNPEGVRATLPATFTVDCTQAGQGPLEVTAICPGLQCY